MQPLHPSLAPSSLGFAPPAPAPTHSPHHPAPIPPPPSTSSAPTTAPTPNPPTPTRTRPLRTVKPPTTFAEESTKAVAEEKKEREKKAAAAHQAAAQQTSTSTTTQTRRARKEKEVKEKRAASPSPAPSSTQGPPTPAATSPSHTAIPSFISPDPLSSDPDTSSDEDAFGRPKPPRPISISSTGLKRPRPSYYYDADFDPANGGKKKIGRRGGMKGIPVFEPTMNEFEGEGGFYGYVKRIEKYGMRSGVVKVIPPKEWSDKLPSTIEPLKDIRLREPIEQHILGSQGLYRVTNVAKTRIWNPAQWKDAAVSSKYEAPNFVEEKKKGERSERSTGGRKRGRGKDEEDEEGESEGESEREEEGDEADGEEEAEEEVQGGGRGRTRGRKSVGGKGAKSASRGKGKGKAKEEEADEDEHDGDGDVKMAPTAAPPLPTVVEKSAGDLPTPPGEPSPPASSLLHDHLSHDIHQHDHSEITPSATPAPSTTSGSPSKAPRKKRASNLQRAEPTLEEWQEFMGTFEELPFGMKKEDYTIEMMRDVERRYWRTLTFGSAPMYGADMKGSLFTDSTKAWNVAQLGDLLPRLAPSTCRIPGVVSPYLYFGMWRATFAWHVEDADLYSINYIHFGAPKFWYSVPQEQAERFERVMEGFFPRDRAKCSQFLRHKSFLASPRVLANSGITLNRVAQLPGEFILTYPKGYHSGFNLGFNCAESINFATERWLPLGKVAKSCFCIGDSVNIDVDVWLNEAAKAEAEARGEVWPPKAPTPPAPEPSTSSTTTTTGAPVPLPTANGTVAAPPKKKRLKPAAPANGVDPSSSSTKRPKLDPSVMPSVLAPYPSSTSLPLDLAPAIGSSSIAPPAPPGIKRKSSTTSSSSKPSSVPTGPPVEIKKKPEPFPCALCPERSTEGLLRIGVEAPVVVVAPTVATDPAMMTDAGDVVATAPAPATVKKVKTKPTLMAHRVCVMFTPATWIELDETTQEEVVRGFGEIEKARWKLKCQLCPELHGTKVQCTKGKCSRAVHVTCALQIGSGVFLDATLGGVSLLAERAEGAGGAEGEAEVVKVEKEKEKEKEKEMEEDGDGEIKLTVLCRTHNPAWQLEETARKAAELKARVTDLSVSTRINVRTHAGLFEVTYVSNVPARDAIAVMFDDGKRTEVKWKNIVFPDSPEVARKKEQAAERARADKLDYVRPVVQQPPRKRVSLGGPSPILPAPMHPAVANGYPSYPPPPPQGYYAPPPPQMQYNGHPSYHAPPPPPPPSSYQTQPPPLQHHYYAPPPPQHPQPSSSSSNGYPPQPQYPQAYGYPPQYPPYGYPPPPPGPPQSYPAYRHSPSAPQGVWGPPPPQQLHHPRSPQPGGGSPKLGNGGHYQQQQQLAPAYPPYGGSPPMVAYPPQSLHQAPPPPAPYGYSTAPPPHHSPHGYPPAPLPHHAYPPPHHQHPQHQIPSPRLQQQQQQQVPASYAGSSVSQPYSQTMAQDQRRPSFANLLTREGSGNGEDGMMR